MTVLKHGTYWHRDLSTLCRQLHLPLANGTIRNSTMLLAWPVKLSAHIFSPTLSECGNLRRAATSA